jgi:hypothetical protein
LTGMFAASLGTTIAFADQQDGHAAAQLAESAPTFDANRSQSRRAERDRCAAFAEMVWPCTIGSSSSTSRQVRWPRKSSASV